jgi:hypothetical protein
LGGGEFGHYDERRLVSYHRSLLAFYRKHYPLSRRLGLWCILFLRSLVRVAAWVAVAFARPPAREKALSSARGYVKTMGILLGEKSA